MGGGAVPFLETDICQLSISSRKRSVFAFLAAVPYLIFFDTRARSTRHARGPRSSGHFEKSRISQTNKERQIRDLKQASSLDFWCNDSRWTLNLLPALFFVSHIGDRCHGKTDRWSGF